jgi:hypothetical protein
MGEDLGGYPEPRRDEGPTTAEKLFESTWTKDGKIAPERGTGSSEGVSQ